MEGLFQCPVNVEVYGQDGSLLGSVIDGAVSYDKRIYIQLSGDGKIVYVPDGLPVQYRITGTDDGTLNYVVEEYKDGNAVGRMNYYDIPLEEGVVYTQSVESGSLSNDLESLPLEGQGGDKIYADEYIEAANKEANVSIDVATEGKGNAIGGGNYALGDQVALMAFPDEGYSFEGWYDGNELIGREYSYYFTARKDRSITARFAFEEKVSTKFIVEMPETYGSNALLAMYDTEDPSSVNMVISMYDGGFDGDMPLKMKGYDRNGGLVFEEEKTATFDGGFHYIVSGLDTTNWHRIEVFGQKGSQIATIKTSEELVDVQEVRLDKSELSLKEGESAKLTATVVPENATDKSVTWKSSNENAATVKDGAVLAIGEGTADVTVTTNSGGKTATAKVAVEKGDGQGVNPAVHVSGVSISPSVLVLSEKSAGKLTATVLPENATDKSMTWKSSNDGIATVNDGTVTGVSEGTAEITVTTNDGAKSA
ncbi:MAG: Ig domain-containing protein, partial [Bacteroidales bacterium]|nr:Ig domain-containing protein [Bacteroidales bacterium]